MDTPVKSTVGTYLCDMPIYILPKLQSYSYGIAVTSCIFMYYFSSSILQRTQYSGPVGNIVLITCIFAVITVIQVVAINTQTMYAKCSVTIYGSFISWIVGAVVGLITFGLIAGLLPQDLPFIVHNENFTTMTLNGGLGGPPPTKVVKDDASPSSSIEKSSKPDDKDEFVCDLYKNGQLITSTVSE